MHQVYNDNSTLIQAVAKRRMVDKPLLELTMTLLNMTIVGLQFATERVWHHMLMHRCNIAIIMIILCNIQMDHI